MGASTSVGRCTFSMTAAVVKLLPEPVMPSSVWNRSPRSMPSASAAIASGWSPAGDRSVTSSSAGINAMLTARYDSYSGGPGAEVVPELVDLAGQ